MIKERAAAEKPAIQRGRLVLRTELSMTDNTPQRVSSDDTTITLEQIRDAGTLHEAYEQYDTTAREIADAIDVELRDVRRCLRHFGCSDVKSPYADTLHDEHWLRDHYLVQDKTQQQIADELDCYKGTVKRWIDEHGLRKR